VGPPLLRRRRRGRARRLHRLEAARRRHRDRPRAAADLTGQGLGARFLEAGLRFGGAERYTLAVAAFNRRAIVVYERAGFEITDRYVHRTNGADHDFLRMERQRYRDG
jgi:RimJ/RimL family protein N-acetyltransferase